MYDYFQWLASSQRSIQAPRSHGVGLPSPIARSDHPLPPESLGQLSPSSLTADASELGVKPPGCALCKGTKYSFTPYFHNTKYFLKPPHEIILLVEKSYILKNRLHSLLVSYVLRDVEQDHVQQVQSEIKAWSQQVDSLESEFLEEVSGSEWFSSALTDAHIWKQEMVVSYVASNSL